jgi:fused signal recognition particle receptor
MSFFRKLKDRMFKSSSKLDEGLDAIIEEGAGEVEDQAEDLRAQEGETAREVPPTPEPEPVPEPEPETAVDPDIPAQFLEPEPEPARA